MAIDWLAIGKWLGPKALKLAKETVAERDAAALRTSRTEHAVAAANEIARMILSGSTTRNANLLNLIYEYNGLLDRGANVPRDLRTMVDTLIEKAREAHRAELVYFEQQYRSSSRSSGPRPMAKKAAKKAPARRAASNAAKKAPAKKAAMKRPASKKVA